MLNQLPYLNFKSRSTHEYLVENASHVIYLCPKLDDFSQLQNTEEKCYLHQWLLSLIHRKNIESKKLDHSFINGDFQISSVSSCFINLSKNTANRAINLTSHKARACGARFACRRLFLR